MLFPYRLIATEYCVIEGWFKGSPEGIFGVAMTHGMPLLGICA